MRDRRLSPQMTRSAKGDEIAGTVGIVPALVPSPRRYVMNVEGAAVASFAFAAKPTRLVAIKNGEAHTPPMCSKDKGTAAPIICMCRAARPAMFRAFFRAKPTPSFTLTRESSELSPAMLARQLCCRDKSRVPAFPRAMPDAAIVMLKHRPAHRARDRLSGICAPIGRLTFGRTKTPLRLSDYAARAPEGAAAMRASNLPMADHRTRMAIFAAIDCGRSIRLKSLPTLRTCLEH